MSEISKAYEPQSVESKWYQYWLDKKFFAGDARSPRPAYSIVIPPPNITGVLHMGHVLNAAMQDILARKARMDGNEVLWLPGTDHASIATHLVLERELKKTERITRHDLGREKFIERAWDWKEKHGSIIIQQLKKLGCSCDWARERFTMDPEYSRCVSKVFVDLFNKGLIYRGKRMVNWCPATLTALSDEEVDMEPQKGFLYYFKVEVAEQPGKFLTIATTRPETIPGDTAIAVNPQDPRYAAFIGQHAIRPLPSELPREKKLIPIIADEHVDFEFGTGVLKVTPAHDKADFEVGQRHNLPAVEIMTPSAMMNDLAGADMSGLDRFEARKVAVEKLRELGSLVKEEPYENKVGFSQRARVPIEPRLSEQWFLKYPSVEQARRCVATGEMKFHPDRWAKVYDHWMGNIQDWCISRQLWWGHRIPVWRRKVTSEDGGLKMEEGEDGGGNSLAGAHSTSSVYVGVDPPPDPEAWEQDPDVLDTWFSSWLWPFATMGWTGDKGIDSRNETLKKFYPTTDLVTAPEIIFFWVARMIMAGYEYMGEMPFRNVYFTGIVRDKLGQKMSKSLGNSPDPLDLIAKYGADAVRFGTMRSAPLGQDVLFDEKDVELGRNFCNKLWNACRFRQMQGGEVQGEIDPGRLRSDEKWILLKLDRAISEVTDSLAAYKFSEAGQTLYRFFWSEFCDWYLEASKPVLQGRSRQGPEADAGQPKDPIPPPPGAAEEGQRTNTLAVMDFVLSHTLRLLHPVLPFITEELWHGMGYQHEMPENQGGQTIQFAPWPKPLDQDFKGFYGLDDCYIEIVDAKYELVTQGRNLRREANIPFNKKVKFIFKPVGAVPPSDVDVLKVLLNAETLEITLDYQPKKGTPTAHSELGELFMPLEGLIDLDAEKARLAKELEKAALEITKVEQKLNNPAFVGKVPTNVLQEHQKRLTDWQAKQTYLQKALEGLGEK